MVPKLAADDVAARLLDAGGVVSSTLQPGVALQLDLPPAAVWAQVDSRMLKQVTINLLSNAARLTTVGCVRLSCSVDVAAGGVEGELGEWMDLRIMVSDTGPGLPKERQASLTEAYGPSVGGTGLGLHLTQQLLRCLGSTLHYEAGFGGVAPGGGPGSSFSFVLRVERTAAVAPPPPERDTIATSEALPEVLRVLIVDDSTMNRKVMKRSLQQLPHTEAWEMVDAETAERAIELATAKGAGFGLIMMDEHLGAGQPRGTDVVRLIRAHEIETGAPRAAIVSCTADVIVGSEDDSTSEDIRVFMEAGVDCVWPKPLPVLTAVLIARLLRRTAAEPSQQREVVPSEPSSQKGSNGELADFVRDHEERRARLHASHACQLHPFWLELSEPRIEAAFRLIAQLDMSRRAAAAEAIVYVGQGTFLLVQQWHEYERWRAAWMDLPWPASAEPPSPDPRLELFFYLRLLGLVIICLRLGRLLKNGMRWIIHAPKAPAPRQSWTCSWRAAAFLAHHDVTVVCTNFLLAVCVLLGNSPPRAAHLNATGSDSFFEFQVSFLALSSVVIQALTFFLPTPARFTWWLPLAVSAVYARSIGWEWDAPWQKLAPAVVQLVVGSGFWFCSWGAERQQRQSYLSDMDARCLVGAIELEREFSVANEKRSALRERECSRWLRHTLCNPLNGVAVPLRFVLDGMRKQPFEPPPADFDDIMESAAVALKQCLDSVNSLFWLQKMWSGKVVPKLAADDVAARLLDAGGVVSSTLQPGVALQLDLPPAAVWAQVDSRMLKQVTINLLSNAARLTTVGCVRLSCSVDVAAGGVEGELGEWMDLRIMVSDTGPGLPKERQASLTEAYGPSVGGTGLGLHLTQQLLRCLGSTLHYEAGFGGVAPGGGPGSSFSFVLRVERTAAVAPPPPERDTIATSEALPEVLRVLIVDDSTMNRKVMKRSLQQLPHTEAWEMVDAETAERAIELATAKGAGFGLIMMDEHLGAGQPRGTDVVRLIRAHEIETGAPRAAIVSCTADVIVGSEDESGTHSNDTLVYLEAGVDCVWPKPLPVLTVGLMAPLLCRYNRGYIRDNVEVDGWRLVHAQ